MTDISTVVSNLLRKQAAEYEDMAKQLRDEAAKHDGRQKPGRKPQDRVSGGVAATETQTQSQSPWSGRPATGEAAE